MNCLLNQCYIAQTVHLRLCKIFKIALSTFIRALTISGFANNANRSGVHTSLRRPGFELAISLYMGVCFIKLITISGRWAII